MSWWNASWAYRQKLTFDNSAQGELSDFPVVVKLTTDDFNFAHAKSAGADIRFVDADDTTELKYEIEKWVDDTEAWIWVKVPTITGSSAADFIYMYFGNVAAEDNQDAPNVWDANFKGVWHLNKEAGSILDSTVNENDGTNVGALRGQTGQIDGAFTFDGIGNIAYFSNPSFIDNTAGAIELLVKLLDLKVDQTLASVTVDGAVDDEFYIQFNPSTAANKQIQVGVLLNAGLTMTLDTDANIITDADFHYLVVESDGLTIRLYLDGVEKTLNVVIGTNSGQWLANAIQANVFNIAGLKRATVIAPANSTTDEVRVSNANRSPDFITAQNLSMTYAFITFGSEEALAVVGRSFGYIIG